MSGGRDRNAAILLALALALTAVVYIGTLRYGFVHDDEFQIVGNATLRDWRFLPGAFTGHLWSAMTGDRKVTYYRPLFVLWFMLNYRLFGLNPAGWHVTTLGLHLLVTFLVFRLARRMLASDAGGAIAALIFGLHPAHIETAAWISGVTDSLMAAPFLASLLCWIRFREGGARRRWWMAASLLFAAAALLAKEPAVALPTVIAAYEMWLLAREGTVGERIRRALVSAAPCAALVAGYLAIRKLVLSGVAGAITAVPAKVIFLTAPSLLWFYVRHLVWPAGISQYYDAPYIGAPALHAFWIPLAIVAACAIALCWWAAMSDSGAVAVSLVWLVVTLAPALDLRALPFGEIAHDRYLYLPSVAFTALLAYSITRIRPTRTQVLGLPAAATAAMAAIIIFFGVATAEQTTQYANNFLLYSRAAEIAPDNAHAVGRLANELLRRGQPDLAIPLLERCTRLAPGDWMSRYVLGQTLYNTGRYAEADRVFTAAAVMQPDNAWQYLYIARSRIQDRRPADAEGPIRRAIELLPAGPGFHATLAESLTLQGKASQAKAEWQAELKNDPQNSAALKALEPTR